MGCTGGLAGASPALRMGGADHGPTAGRGGKKSLTRFFPTGKLSLQSYSSVSFVLYE